MITRVSLPLGASRSRLLAGVVFNFSDTHSPKKYHALNWSWRIMTSTESNNKMECDFAAIADENILSFISFSSSSRDVCYSCGSCGYELNLNSCNRYVSAIDSKYGKSMNRGVISFFSIDESRFTQINKLQLLPSKSSWRLFRRRTKLFCRNCGNCIGTVSPFQLVKSKSATWDGISACRTYDIKISSIRPVSSEESNFFIGS